MKVWKTQLCSWPIKNNTLTDIRKKLIKKRKDENKH